MLLNLRTNIVDSSSDDETSSSQQSDISYEGVQYREIEDFNVNDGPEGYESKESIMLHDLKYDDFINNKYLFVDLAFNKQITEDRYWFHYFVYKQYVLKK